MSIRAGWWCALALLVVLCAAPVRAEDAPEEEATLWVRLMRWACTTWVTLEGTLAGSSLPACMVNDVEFAPTP